MVASLLVATVVTAILRCDFCAAKLPTLWAQNPPKVAHGSFLTLKPSFPDFGDLAPVGQGGSRGDWKYARELWRSLANPMEHSPEPPVHIHQSSGEGPPRSPEFR